MTKIEKTVITIETRQRILIRQNRRSIFVWCGQCAAESLMVSTNEAAKLASTSARDIFRRVEAGNVHFLETEDGRLLICLDSLSDSIKIRK
jgi:hypothetical protein